MHLVRRTLQNRITRNYEHFLEDGVPWQNMGAKAVEGARKYGVLFCTKIVYVVAAMPNGKCLVE